MTTYQGILTFFTETGTEGGSWAFQDEKFMGLPAPPEFTCTRCGLIWNKDRSAEPPAPMFTYWRESRSENGKNYLAGYYGADTYDPDGNLGPGEFNRSFVARGNELARLCSENGHAEWTELYPNGISSYEGLHELASGDRLTVWDGDHVLFQGTVRLPPRQDPYAKDAYVAHGYTAHRRPPVGTIEDWWFEERRATLTEGHRDVAEAQDC